MHVSFNSSNITFSDFEIVLDALLKRGWSYNKNGVVFYMVDGTYDFETTSISDYNNVYERIKSSILKGNVTTLDLVWKNTNVVIALTYMDRNCFDVALVEDVRKLPELDYPDLSWYFERISSIFSLPYIENVTITYE